MSRMDRSTTFSDEKFKPFKYTFYPYSIETKNGKLIKYSIKLNSSHSSSNAGNYGNISIQTNHSWTREDHNLIYFLQNMDTNHIKERKMNRINASVAALVARQAFQFSAIDGTGLGSLSASLVVCLSWLTVLYDERKSKYRTNSFYPLHLGGVLRLNLAATPLQWLTTRQTNASIEAEQRSFDTKSLSGGKFLNVRIIKGDSCENEEYHRFMERLASLSLDYPSKTDETKALAMSPNKASLVIESEQACRHCKLRKDGNVEGEIGALFNNILRALNIFASRSDEYICKESRDKFECNQVIDRVVYELGALNVKK
ncbi:hypothetical protein HJC23_013841, partial [Cyclotella cryptica]